MNNVDTTTVAMILNVKKGSRDPINDDIATIWKEIKDGDDGPPSEEQRKAVEFLMGKTVYIKWCDGMYGVVVGLNESGRGFYPGGRYPVYVKIADDLKCGVGAGMVFEYGLEWLLLEPVNKKQ